MKRDWELIKEILTAIEENKVRIHWEQLDKDKQKIVLMHYDLLQESNLIINYKLQSDMDDDGKITYHPNYIIQDVDSPAIRMTMKGFDMLEVLRDQTLWNKILSKAKNLGVKLTYEYILQAVPFLYKQMMN